MSGFLICEVDDNVEEAAADAVGFVPTEPRSVRHRLYTEEVLECTFIILDKEFYQQNGDEINSMIGDTNIFLSNDGSKFTGEIEIMIAEKQARGKKLGWEAVVLMLIYGISYIKIKSFQAKISLYNDISIKMFTKLGFTEKSRSAVFEEVTYEKNVDDDWLKWLRQQTEFDIREYNF